MHTNATTNSTSRANRRSRRLVTAAAVLAASILVGACGPESADTSASAPATERRSSTQPRTEQGEGLSIGTSDRFGATEAVETSQVEVARDEHGDAILVPAGSSDGDGVAEVPQLHRRGEAETGNGTGTWNSMYEFVEFVLQANDEYWVQVFAENGLPEPMVNYIIPEPGVSYTTACSATDDTSMFYCPADDTIAFSQAIATSLWDGTYVGPDGQYALGEVGDYATALLVTHEYAHSVQAELGYGSHNVSIPMLEQHADCWSGVFTAYAESQGMLDPGDVYEGVVGAFLVGDSHFDSPTHHGTSEDRIIAYATGYNSGSPDACGGYLPA